MVVVKYKRTDRVKQGHYILTLAYLCTHSTYHISNCCNLLVSHPIRLSIHIPSLSGIIVNT